MKHFQTKIAHDIRMVSQERQECSRAVETEDFQVFYKKTGVGAYKYRRRNDKVCSTKAIALFLLNMPTINQLVKKRRKRSRLKKKTVALTRSFNTLKNRPVFYPSPF